MEYLWLIREGLESSYGAIIHFDVNFDSDGEIFFKYWVAYGFENIFENKKTFNACDHKTNIRSFRAEVDAINDRAVEIITAKRARELKA